MRFKKLGHRTAGIAERAHPAAADQASQFVPAGQAGAHWPAYERFLAQKLFTAFIRRCDSEVT